MKFLLKKYCEIKLVLLFTAFCFPKGLSAAGFGVGVKQAEIFCKIKGLGDSNGLAIRIAGDVLGAYGNENVGYMNSKDAIIQIQSRIIPGIRNGDDFKFDLSNLNSPKYAVLYSIDRSLKAAKLIDATFIIDPGDSIAIYEKNGSLVFTGKDAKRLGCEYAIFKLGRSPTVLNQPVDPSEVLHWYNTLDSVSIASIAILNSFRSSVSNNEYWILYAHIVSYYQHLKIHYLYWRNGFSSDSADRFLSILAHYKSPIWNNEIQSRFRRIQVLQHSLEYLDFRIEQYKFDTFYNLHESFDVVNCYLYFISRYEGPVREWIIYRLVNDNLHKSGQNIGFCIQNALNSGYIKNSSISDLFEKIRHKNIIGSPAYDFSLSDIEGNVVHLTDFRGKVVLLDFWYIGCGACIRLHPYLQSIKDRFNRNDFVLVSICIDYTGAARKYWSKAIEGNKYTSLSNINLFAGGNERGDPAITRIYEIKACPTIILIDKDGNLTEQPEDPRIDNGESLMLSIKKYLEKSHS